jgi:hypothetical protein
MADFCEYGNEPLSAKTGNFVYNIVYNGGSWINVTKFN